MKKIILLSLLLLILGPVAFAQVPEKINFQTVVRDNIGNPMASQNMDVRFSIMYGTPQPNRTAYQEVHSAISTDAFGLINVKIGSGDPDTLTYLHFEDIAWEDTFPYFLKVEVNTGNGYADLGLHQFVSVPFSLHAKKADSVQHVSLEQLGDVDLSGLQDGDILKYNQQNEAWETGTDAGSLWIPINNDIYYSAGNVGIGTTNPLAGLTLGSSRTLAFSAGFNPPVRRDLISLFGANTFEGTDFTGFGYESALYNNGQNTIAEQTLYAKSEGGHRWYILTNADGGAGASMALDRHGSLGLGIHTPAARLHIDDYIDIDNNDPYGSLMIGTTGWLSLAMDRDEIQAYNSNGSPSVMYLQRRGDDLALGMGNGNVGIGISSNIRARLHIKTGYDAALNSNTNNGYLMLGDIGSLNVIMDNNEIMARDGTGTANLHLQGDGGTVTIGSPSGNHLLANQADLQTKNGNTNVGNLYLQRLGGNVVATGGTGRMGIGGFYHSGAELSVQSTEFQLRFHNPSAGGNDWFVGTSNNGWNAGGGKLVFSETASSSSALMALDGTKDGVAIGGTYVPTNFKLAVDGRVICEEIWVRESGFWPDYVFGESYELRSLAEVEEHIEAHHHLPGIPSAAEIEAEGIAVGKMQKMMMEKIEELTLYVIEQDKKITEQDQKIKALEEQLK